MKPSTARSFLTAKWANVALLTYAVDPEVLEPLLPPECQLDLRDGRAFVSLVAFDFLDTRVHGIPWPGYRNFPEINLRFYVRHGEHRGVSFIQEFVPQRLVAFMARTFYNEPYRAAAMVSKTTSNDETIEVEHQLNYGGRQHRLKLCGSISGFLPADDSIEHFFKEHSWGFGTSRHRQLLRYRVIHPQWNIWPLKSWELDWDWSAVYGNRWSFLQKAEPYSVIFAEGSDVRVSPCGKGAIVD